MLIVSYLARNESVSPVKCPYVAFLIKMMINLEGPALRGTRFAFIPELLAIIIVEVIIVG
jgi:hypothetical protein